MRSIVAVSCPDVISIAISRHGSEVVERVAADNLVNGVQVGRRCGCDVGAVEDQVGARHLADLGGVDVVVTLAITSPG